MDKKALCERYMEAVRNNRIKEDALNDALRTINCDNSIFGIIPENYEKLTNDMFLALVGDNIYDWVGWWLYDASETNNLITTETSEFQVNSFDELWEVVLKDYE